MAGAVKRVLFHSIRYWLILLFLAVLVPAALLVYAFTANETRSRLVNQRMNALRNSAPIVQETLYASLHPDPETGRITFDKQALSHQVGYLDSQLNARIVLLSLSGSVIADSRGIPAFVAADYPLIRQAWRRATTQMGTITVDGTPYAMAAVPISRPGMGVVSEVVIASSLKTVYATVRAVRRELIFAAALAFVVALITIMLASQLISSRLRRIECGAQAVAAGDLRARVKVGVEDEIGRLGLAFNTMGEQLGTAFETAGKAREQAIREKEQTDLLLNDLLEGVIGLTVEGRVVVVNPSAIALLGQPVPPGALAGEALSADLLEVWRESRETGREVTRVLERDDGVLEATVYPAAAESRIAAIVVLRDVTEQVHLGRARRDFAANASHQLKTPLFSLAGFVELLSERDLDRPTQQRFLGLMKLQVDRLTALSTQLLDLSRLDAGATLVRPVQTDVIQIVRKTLNEFQADAQEKDVLLELRTPLREISAVCDADHVHQIMCVLLDNAVKASPRGGHVAVELKDGDRVTVLVHDEGPGVPAEEIERIFERFYRGKQTAGDGSGLGLAIAHELASMMGGDVTAEAASGHGGCFRLTLPNA